MKAIQKFGTIGVLYLLLTLLICQIPLGASAATESLDYSTMVSEEVVAGGAPISKTLVDYQFLFGDFENGSLQAFSKWFGDGSGTPDDSLASPADVTTPDNGQNVLWRWQWRATATSATVLKITAKENMRLDITQRDTLTDQWATHSAFRFIAENPDGIRMVVRRMDVAATMDPDTVKTTVHLAKGDTLYIVYAIMNGDPGTATASFIPQFGMDTAAYDEAQRPEYETVTALETLKEEKAAALQEKYTEMVGDGEAYSTARAAELEGIVDEAVESFADLSSEEEVNAAFEEATAKMDAVPTLAKEQEELQAYMTQQKNDLAGYAQKEDYSTKNWKVVEEYLTQANAALDEAQTAAAVNTIIARAKANIDSVAKKEGPGMMPWIIGGAVVLAAAVAAVVILVVVRKKRARGKAE